MVDLLDLSPPPPPNPLLIRGGELFSRQSSSFRRSSDAAPSRALFQDASYISFPVENGDDLKGGRLRPVHNGVVGITSQRPETQRAGCEIGTGMAAHGRLGNRRASVVNRLFYAPGGVFAVIGNVTPDVKNIRFGKRRESINAHRLDKRQSSFIA